MSVVPVADVLQGRVAVDSEVTVRGWVLYRRDSKAGFLSSPSMTVPALILYRPLLIISANYNQEVLRLTTGCSVIVTGKVVASSGVRVKAFEIQATSVGSDRLGGRPGHLPDGGQAPQHQYLRE